MEAGNYKEQIKRIVNGVNILSIDKYEILGKSETVKYQSVYQNYTGDLKSFGGNQVVDETQQKSNLVQALTNRIYGLFYCGIPIDYPTEFIPSKVERDQFMDQLSLANSSKGGLDYNWTIYNIDGNGNTFAKKGEELRWLQPKGYQFQDPNQTQVAVNTRVNLVKTKESKTIQPVFYHVFGDELFPQETELARFYWNTTPEGAGVLVEKITSVLNDYRIQFQFKCLNHPDLYVRSDSAVLYCPKKYVPVVLQLLKHILPELKPYLKEETPMFTKRLYKGLSYAEDPGKGMSFGMSRSTIIANALVDAFVKDEKDVYAFVEKALETQGMLLDALHLNKHTVLTPNFPSYE